MTTDTEKLSELQIAATITLTWAKDEASKTKKTADLLAAYKRLAELGEQASDLAKTFNKARTFIKEVVIPERFEAEDLKTVTLDELNRRFTVSSQLRASIKADMKEDAYKWLRDEELGDLIKETVNASALGALARDYVAHNKELPEELFNQQYFNNTSMTKTK